VEQVGTRSYRYHDAPNRGACNT